MPDETLLSEIEQLANSYSQRQKATNSAQAALKGMSGALTKAERALRTYADQNGTHDDSAVERSRAALAETQLKEQVIDLLMPELRREIKRQTVLAAALKEVLAALRAESIDVIKLSHGLTQILSQKPTNSALTALLPQLEGELERAQHELSSTFGVSLRHAFDAQGLALGGSPPRFEVGRFEINANIMLRSASILYGKEVVIKRVPLSVEVVLKAYQTAQKQIYGRGESAAQWMELLYTAWENVRRKRGVSEPRANIVECYLELLILRQPKAFRAAPGKSSFAEYSRAQFAYDFATFTEAGIQVRGLRAFGLPATKSHTDNPERSIFIVNGESPHSGSYIGDIKFDRDE
jgi:hypothetical protein